MKRLLGLMLSLFIPLMAWSADGEQFTEESNGITLTYTIVSESDKTCATAAQTSLPVDAAIVIPSTANGYKVVGIGYRSFRNFAIKSISFPNGLKYIGEEAFEGCSHLTGTLLIPKTVTSISRQAFKDCNMTSVRLLGGVKTVGIEAFRECTSLTQVTMGEGVETIGESMFSGCTNLATVYFPSTITSIGANAFSGTAWNTNLPEGMTYIGTIAYKYKNVDGNTTVTIKDGTKSIYRYAFASSNVTSITIPTSVTAIGEYAFENCKSLSSIITSGIGSMWSVYLANLEEIGDYAFSGCSSIESVYLPSKIETISKGLFYDCTSLTSVQTSNLTGIGASAFSGCSSLATFTIPNSVTSIGQTAFYGCEKLKEVNIPQGVSSIGQMTFENCKGLTAVKLHEGITAIGIRAFSNCTGLTEITIPGTLRTMETWDNCWAFSGCTGLKKITINEGAALLGWNTFASCYNVETVVVWNKTPISVYDSFKNFANNATLYVPSGCTAAYSEASDWKDFKAIVEMSDDFISFKDAEVRDICISKWDTNGDGFLSKGEAAAVTDIGKTFQSKGKIRFFDELKYFTGIQSIGKEAFENCGSLSSVTIPENVTFIGQQAFRYCNFSTIVIPEKVKTIASEAFQGCSQLTSIDIPSGVTVLNKGVFDGCTCLESINIPNSVETIGDKAFRSCKGFVAIDIPNGVTSLGGSVFEGCTNLASVSFPESLTTIGTYIFENCPALEAISVNDNNATFESPQGSNAIIKKVTKTLVLGCKTTVVPTDVKVIGNSAFYKCTGLSSINLPESVETIEQSAFYKCAGLSSIQFPDALTSIGDYAFESCSALTSITLPANVSSIGREAFEYCSGLTSVTALRETPAEIGNSAFYPRTDVTLYVPAGCKDAYQTAWGTFKEIVELTDGASFVVGYPFGNITYKILSITDKTCEVSYSSSLKGEVVIPSSVNGYQVIGFGAYAFEEEEDFTSIVIPSSITYMRNNAFKKTYLENVYISDLEAWCRIEFSGYNSNPIAGCNLYVNGELVTDLVIPDNITAIKACAFCYGKSITSITLHENVASIGESAFYGCNGLASVTVGASEPVAITSDVFSNSSNATLYVPAGSKAAYEAATGWKDFKEIVEGEAPSPTIAFADAKVKALCVANWDTNKDGELSEAEAAAVTDLGEVFKENTEITSFDEFEYFSGVTELSAWMAFEGCTALKSIIIPAGVRRIDGAAFANCAALETISIDAMNSIYESPAGCNAVIEKTSNKIVVGCANTVIPNTVTTIGDASFWGRWGMASIDIPESVTVIEQYAFTWSNMSEFTMPSKVEIIDTEAFAYTGLKSVTLPATLTAIGDGAFNGCDDLVEVTVENPTPVAITENVFSNRANATLYVPGVCVAAYRAADYWKEFGTIMSYDSNLLYADDLQTLPGTTAVLAVNLDNVDKAIACKFDLRLPAGVTVATTSNGKLDATLTERAENHSISSNHLDNGDYRFVITSHENDLFTGNSGALVEIKLDIPLTMECGDYTVQVFNTDLTAFRDNTSTNVKLDDMDSKLTVTYMRGDVNCDGSVSVTDVGCTINYILERVPEVFVKEAADMDGDNEINVTDVTKIIDFILDDDASMAPRRSGYDPVIPHLSLQQTADGYALTMDEKDAFVGFQFDVELAARATVNSMQLNSNSDHLLTYRRLDNGMYRVVCYSLSNSTFADDEAPLLNMFVTGDVSVSSVLLTTAGLTGLRATVSDDQSTGIASMNQALQMSVQGRTLQIVADRDVTLRLYTTGGSVYRVLNVHSGVNTFEGLKAGVYMIENRKMIIR